MLVTMVPPLCSSVLKLFTASLLCQSFLSVGKLNKTCQTYCLKLITDLESLSVYTIVTMVLAWSRMPKNVNSSYHVNWVDKSHRWETEKKKILNILLLVLNLQVSFLWQSFVVVVFPKSYHTFALIFNLWMWLFSVFEKHMCTIFRIRYKGVNMAKVSMQFVFFLFTAALLRQSLLKCGRFTQKHFSIIKHLYSRDLLNMWETVEKGWKTTFSAPNTIEGVKIHKYLFLTPLKIWRQSHES